MRLHLRLALAAAWLFLEKALLDLFVDYDAIARAEGLGAALRVGQHWGFRFLVSFAIATVLFGYLRGTAELHAADAAGRGAPLRTRFLLLHLVLIAPLVPLSMLLYGRESSLPFPVVVALWVLFAAAAAAALLAFFAPWALWRRAAAALGSLSWYAALAAAGSVLAMGWSQRLWTTAADATFQVVYRLLRWFIPDLQVEPTERIIDTGNFTVYIDQVCSGLEGLGLMLAFCTVLLLLFRREYRFPRALLLVPVGLLLSFLLNILRIAALVLIGHRGYPDVAIYGFHSQAGWLAFNAAAAGVALVSLRSPWLTQGRSAQVGRDNPTAAYLLPFMALLLGGMLSRAASGTAESFYWLRLVAFAAALSYAWPGLRGAHWQWSWRGPLTGLVVFALWLGCAGLLGQSLGAPPVLAAAAGSLGLLYAAFYLLTTVAASPVAEELALRGYLLRRIVTERFEELAPAQAGIGPWLISAAASGLLAGDQWLPGVIAGVFFGRLYMRTGRLGEAVAAHVTANLLLAALLLVIRAHGAEP
jgi:exosortase E/protease (VPEID-CTERM system)